jgi:CBS domain-containing protein
MFDHDILEPHALVEPEAIMTRGQGRRRLASRTPIRALTVKPPLLLPIEISVVEAARLMMDEDVRAALMVSGDSVVGIVTESDISRALAQSSDQ